MSDVKSDDQTAIEPVILNHVVTVLAIAVIVGSVAWAMDLYRVVGLQLYTEQYLGGMLTIALPLVYIAVPAGKGRRRKGAVPWYDLVAAVVGCAAAAHTAARYPVLTDLIGVRPAEGMIVGAIMIVLLIEGLRRTVGIVLPIVVVFFLAMALIGDRFPGDFQGRPIAFENLVYYLGWDSTALLGTPMRIVTTIVVAFVLFGRILFSSGGSSFFTDIATVLMGRYRGGPAKISVFASSLFGSISGSTVSNVVTTGVITIPLMRRGGYQAHHAGAIEAVASTGGQLMPPVMGASAFLMAEFLQIPYTEVVLAALIPAVLYYVALFAQADLEAAKGGIKGIAEALIPAAWPVLKHGWFFPLPFAVLIYALFWLNRPPETAALWAAFVVVVATTVFGYRGKRLSAAVLFDAVRTTGLSVLDIFMIGAAAGLVIGSLNISGLGFALTLVLVQVASGSLILLLVMAAVVCIFLGMGMPTVGVYVLLATLVAPALQEVGVQPIAAHMFILYFGMMSMITPPVCIGAFAAATLSGSDPMRTGFAAMRFGWLAFVIPFMFVASPTLLMYGNPLLITIDLVTALIGTWLISLAMAGYFWRVIGAAERVVFVAAGLALVMPLAGIERGDVVNLAGFAVGAVLIAFQFRARQNQA